LSGTGATSSRLQPQAQPTPRNNGITHGRAPGAAVRGQSVQRYPLRVPASGGRVCKPANLSFCHMLSWRACTALRTRLAALSPIKHGVSLSRAVVVPRSQTESTTLSALAGPHTYDSDNVSAATTALWSLVFISGMDSYASYVADTPDDTGSLTSTRSQKDHGRHLAAPACAKGTFSMVACRCNFPRHKSQHISGERPWG